MTTTAFTGTRGGASVSLSFPLFGPFGGQTLTGSLKGDTLVLNLPRGGGGFTVLTFRKGGVARYNLVVTALQKRADELNAAYALEQNRLAKGRAVMGAYQALSDKASALPKLEGRLAASVKDLQNALEAAAGHVSKMQTQLDAIRKRYSDIQEKAAAPLSCDALGDLRYAVSDDLRYSLEQDLRYTLEQDFGYVVRVDVREAKTDFAAAYSGLGHGWGDLLDGLKGLERAVDGYRYPQGREQLLAGLPKLKAAIPALVEESRARVGAQQTAFETTLGQVGRLGETADGLYAQGQEVLADAQRWVGGLTCQQTPDP